MSETQVHQTFSAIVSQIDINPYVEVPEVVIRELQKEAKKEKGPILVKGSLQGKSFSSTVVKYRGLWRLYLNTVMRAGADVQVGDQVRIDLHFDPSPRVVAAPPEFTLALSKNEPARGAFQKLTPSRQKEIFLYLNNLKQSKTLENNIE